MDNQRELSLAPVFDLFIVILSVYVLAALLVDTFFQLDPETSRLLYIIDDLICIVFLIDFFLRYRRASSKTAFM